MSSKRDPTFKSRVTSWTRPGFSDVHRRVYAPRRSEVGWRLSGGQFSPMTGCFGRSETIMSNVPSSFGARGLSAGASTESLPPQIPSALRDCFNYLFRLTPRLFRRLVAEALPALNHGFQSTCSLRFEDGPSNATTNQRSSLGIRSEGNEDSALDLARQLRSPQSSYGCASEG